MALTDEGNGRTDMVMPVQPMSYGNNGGNYGVPYAVPYAMPMTYGNGGGNNDFLGGDGSWLILFLILALSGMWGGNGFGGFGGGMCGMDGAFPWLISGQQGINANTNAGFNQAGITSALGDLSGAVTSGLGDVQLGIAGVNQNICQTGAGITNAVNQGISGVQQSLCNGFANTNQTIQNGFAQAEISDNARQIANMQQAFNTQTAVTGAITNLASQQADCCCENRLATANLGAQIAREACADRETVNLGVRDLLANNTANSQAVLNAINSGIQSINDKLCQQELDAERRENQNLRSELMYARGQASQTDQTAQILANNNAQTALFQQAINNETDALYARLKNCPIPTQPVYGNQPIFTCQPQCGCNSGCGCNGGFN